MRKLLPFIVLIMFSVSMLSAAEIKYPEGKTGKWQGFTQYSFSVENARCKLVVPAKAAVGRPWIWRARFFGHQPQLDKALLSQGWHLFYCEVGGLFGCPKAVAKWDACYKYLVETVGLSRKTVLEGMSRGGLIIYNWATKNPEKVLCIYGDAPVCDFKSWPGGKGKSSGSGGDWKHCKKVYGLTEEEALAYKKNPIDNLKPIAEAKIPIIHVCGAADKVVPMAENTGIIEKRYKKLGGVIKVIAKPGVGHHPHSLKDPKVLVEFITNAWKKTGLTAGKK